MANETAEAFEQYNKALRAGQKYYRAAMSAGRYPYPPVLDEILDEHAVSGNRDLGLVDVPTELIAGTKSAGRAAALAGNFMPLLDTGTEFAGKWMHLCEAHLSEGIRDPITCCEFLGRFYVQEGHKRASVLMSYGAPSIHAQVTRMLPVLTDDPAVRMYYEFMDFFNLAGLFGVDFSRSGSYEKLQAALGMDPDHVWTEQERSSFSAGFARFREAFARQSPAAEAVTPADALLAFLQVFPFSVLKDASAAELSRNLGSIWTDVLSLGQESLERLELRTAPEEKQPGLISRIRSLGQTETLHVAFLYGFDPEESAWTRDHDKGREFLESQMGERIRISTYRAYNGAFYETMEEAVGDGAKLLFATMPSMIDAARRIAALHDDVRVLVCALSLPYTGVRMYYCRTYETKFITGAIAGAMAEGNRIGYIADYPIAGVPASINAFALGARMTNPRAKIHLLWSCLPGNPVREFYSEGVRVISNRDAVNTRNPHWALEWGVYSLEGDSTLRPLGYPVWNWGPMYERIVRSVLNGSWDTDGGGKAVNYWWGMDTGVIDVKLSQALPDGVWSLGQMLKRSIAGGEIDLFRTRITDQYGVVRNDGVQGFSHETCMEMDWLCDNVEGSFPKFAELLPQSRSVVRLLGLNRDSLPPEKAEAQL